MKKNVKHKNNTINNNLNYQSIRQGLFIIVFSLGIAFALLPTLVLIANATGLLSILFDGLRYDDIQKSIFSISTYASPLLVAFACVVKYEKSLSRQLLMMFSAAAMAFAAMYVLYTAALAMLLIF